MDFKPFKNNNKDHLEFYLENSISPVHQNIKNLKKHFERRGSLYTRLGLNSNYIEKSSIVEIGPGSGHNSLYISSCKPKKYVLVEPNETGYDEIKYLYKKNKNLLKPKIINKKLEDLKFNKEFDISICEAWIGSRSNELKLFSRLKKITKKNGLIVTTFQPSIGMYPNILRRLISYKITENIFSIDEKTKILIYFFENHLKSLKNMTRPLNDWVQDNLINPAALTSCLPLELLKKNIQKSKIYRTYPDLNQLDRWYKTLIGKDFLCDDDFLKSYYKKYLNFFDYRSNHLKTKSSVSKKIDLYLYNFYSEIYNYEKETSVSQKDLIKILESLKKINTFFKSHNLNDISKITEETIKIILNDRKINKKQIDNLSLKSVFGKELCYISFINL